MENKHSDDGQGGEPMWDQRHCCCGKADAGESSGRLLRSESRLVGHRLELVHVQKACIVTASPPLLGEVS
ncbi:hypothetical protein EAG_08697 [Camponotus floridanus]|uniref:Uncharacterized protein n=1 Tax=Camponotus floridanus TaxID=104421 RepID=E1ZVT9_CAMFO|nr:hypothetical protein EAG_08697 [Camponotus floridanus]